MNLNNDLIKNVLIDHIREYMRQYPEYTVTPDEPEAYEYDYLEIDYGITNLIFIAFHQIPPPWLPASGILNPNGIFLSIAPEELGRTTRFQAQRSIDYCDPNLIPRLESAIANTIRLHRRARCQTQNS